MRRLPRTNSATGTKCGLRAFAEKRTAGAEEQVLDELLCEGRRAASALAFHIVLGGDLDLVPIESMMLVEARILCGDDGVLEVGGDLAERDEFVPFLIGRRACPGLQAALGLHRGCRRVDPAQCDDEQDSQAPEKRDPDDEPSNEGSEGALPKRVLEARECLLAHIPEYWLGEVAACG
jgi:hypothetical protein